MQRLRSTRVFVALLLAGCPAVPGVDATATDGIDLESISGGETSSPSHESTSGSAGHDASTHAEGESTDAEIPAPATTSSSSSTGAETGEPECLLDAHCADASFCNGAEQCVDGVCVDGEPVVCSDDIACTTIECDDAAGACVATPHDDQCGCGETCDVALGCGIHCTIALCSGDMPYACADCVDNDGDCLVDAMDPDCWGPCSNNEAGWNGDVPGQQNQSECNVMDCYFDANSGAGNDDCYWSHTCDPLDPTWHDDCTYDPDYTPPGAGNDSCVDLGMQQSDTCESTCGPLTPNGCDCFGCCEVELDDGSLTTVYLASTDIEGEYTCSAANAQDPEKCHPCTQVPACLNPCEGCELCLGEVELPEGCEEQECAGGLQPCGLAGQEPCPELQACVTGCCVPAPQ